MNDTDHNEPTPIVEEAGLNIDVLCQGCGYNLRGLQKDHRCPECNLPVGESLHENLLRFASRPYLECMSRGIVMAYRSVFWYVLFSIGGSLTVGIIFMASSNVHPDWIHNILIGLVGLAVLLCVILFHIGIWRATIPDPVENEEEHRIRIFLRWSSMALIPTGFLWAAVTRWSGFAGAAQPMVIEIGSLMCFSIVAVNNYSLARFSYAVFGRCEHDVMSRKYKRHDRSFRHTVKATIIVPILLVVVHFGLIVFSKISPGALWAVFVIGSGIGAFFIVLTWLGAVSVMTYLTKPLKHERLMAIANDAIEEENRKCIADLPQ